MLTRGKTFFIFHSCQMGLGRQHTSCFRTLDRKAGTKHTFQLMPFRRRQKALKLKLTRCINLVVLKVKPLTRVTRLESRVSFTRYPTLSFSHIVRGTNCTKVWNIKCIQTFAAHLMEVRNKNGRPMYRIWPTLLKFCLLELNWESGHSAQRISYGHGMASRSHFFSCIKPFWAEQVRSGLWKGRYDNIYTAAGDCGRNGGGAQ